MALIWVLFNNFSGNPPNGRTGAPGDGLCSDCHSGSNPNGFDGSVDITGLPTTLMPNTTYPLTLTVANPNGAATRAGFQWVALNSSNTNAGSMSNSSSNATITNAAGRTYHEHNPAQFFAGNTTLSWTVDWTSPAASANDETITLYAAAIVGNGSGSGGDLIVTAQISRSLPGGGGIPLTAAIGSEMDVSCSGGADGSAIAIAFDGTPPYSYQWSNGENEEIAINLPAGAASVTITDAAAGSATASTTIGEPSPIQVSIQNQSIIDCNSPTATATASASGGIAPYNYQWSSGEIGPIATNLSAGSNQVTITDNNNCTFVQNLVVEEDINLPVTNAGSDQTISCSVSTAQLDGSVTNCDNCTFVWTTIDGNIVSGANSLTAVVDAGGTYTLIATNNNNACSSFDEVVVLENTTAPTANAGDDQTLNCQVISVQLNATTDCVGCNFEWSLNGNPISTMQTIDVSETGTYLLTVIDPNTDCSATDEVIIDENTAAPDANAGADQLLTCVNTSVQLEGNSDNCPNCTFSWTSVDGNIVSNPDNATITVDAPGTYILNVTDPNNACVASDEVIVNEDTVIPSVDAGADQALDCNTTQVDLTASGCINCTYNWTTADGNIISDVNNATITVDAAGTYIVVATDPNNACTASDEVQVSQDISTPSIVISGPLIICDGDPATLTTQVTGGTMPYTYEWNNGETTAAIDVQPNVTTDYSVTVTGANGCTSTAQVTLTVNENPTANAGIDQSVCEGGSANLIASANGGTSPYSYEWSDGLGTNPMLTFTPTNTSTISVTVTDANGCTDVDEVNITVNELATITLDNQTNVSCNGDSDGSISINVGNGVDPLIFAWSNGANTQNIDNLAAGTYDLTLTNGNGCTSTFSATITEPSPLSLNPSATGETAQGADDGTATVQASGGTAPYTFAWSNGAQTQSIDGLAPDIYTVTVTDDNGCFATAEISVASFDCQITASATTTNVTCNGGEDGTLSIQVNDAQLPIDIQWSNGLNGLVQTNLMAGTYSVSITDAVNCLVIVNFTINEPDELVMVVNTQNETAAGANDGSASAVISGGTPPYTYEWSTGENTEMIENLAPGSYSLSVSDANGCVTTATFTIDAFLCSDITFEVDQVNNVCSGEANGSIDITNIQGANGELSFLWSNGEMSSSLMNLPTGEYSLTITDEANCSVSETYEITEEDNELPIVAVNSLTLSLDGDGNATLTAEQVDGGSTDNCGIASIAISQETFDCSNIGENTIDFIVTDLSGNQAVLPVIIFVQDDIAPVIICPENITSVSCGAITYMLPTVSDNCPTVSSELIEGLPPEANFPEGETTVTYEAIDESGNTESCTFLVTVANTLSANAVVTDVSCNGDSDGSIDVIVVGGTPPYEVQGETQDLAAGTYTLTIVDATGCTFGATATVAEPVLLNMEAIPQSVACFGDSDGSIIVEISGGTPPYTITDPLENLPAGTYIVSATDANGCQVETSATIMEPDELVIVVDDVQPQFTGDADMLGSITVSIEGGTGGLTFEWIKDGNVISTEEDLTDLEAGTYTLIVTDDNGCSTAQEVVVDIIVNNLEPENLTSFEIYPNPTDGLVDLQLSLNVWQSGTIQLFNVAGKQVSSLKFEGTKEFIHRIDMSMQPKGLYFIQLTLNGEQHTKRIIKQ